MKRRKRKVRRIIDIDNINEQTFPNFKQKTPKEKDLQFVTENIEFLKR